MTARPILYSFRRCPYAMRARMAIASAGIEVELREVVLRDKPADMLNASAKGTVPVLLPEGDIGHEGTPVIDESLDVMLWALGQNDPACWLAPDHASMMALIADIDGPFKHHLDRFKYATRYEDADPVAHRTAAKPYLNALDARLKQHAHLMGAQTSLADIAIFPFIRQFAGAAGHWFSEGRFPALKPWLEAHIHSPIFNAIMKKYPQWHAGDAATLFP